MIFPIPLAGKQEQYLQIKKTWHKLPHFQRIIQLNFILTCSRENIFRVLTVDWGKKKNEIYIWYSTTPWHNVLIACPDRFCYASSFLTNEYRVMAVGACNWPLTCMKFRSGYSYNPTSHMCFQGLSGKYIPFRKGIANKFRINLLHALVFKIQTVISRVGHTILILCFRAS